MTDAKDDEKEEIEESAPEEAQLRDEAEAEVDAEKTDAAGEPPSSSGEADDASPESAPPEESPVVEEAPSEEQPPVAPEPAKRKGGVLVWLVLLLALGGIGGVGYLYYELIYLDPSAPLVARVEQSQNTAASELQSLERSVSDQLRAAEADRETAISEAMAGIDNRMSDAEAGFAEALSNIVNAAPPSEREWKLAEAAYLLRIANHRVLMEGDVRSALTMLEAADQIMLDLDDFTLHEVRAALADELLALRRVRGADVQGIYLTIEAIKNQLDGLPIALPEYLTTEPEMPVVAEDATLWQVLSERFFSLFAFRNVGRDGVRPLLSPEESVYLEQNIRLTLEQAQLAALKRHQVVYETSLTNAKRWVENYLAGDTEEVQEFGAALDELLTVDLQRDLPDISGSLTALNAVMRGES